LMVIYCKLKSIVAKSYRKALSRNYFRLYSVKY